MSSRLNRVWLLVPFLMLATQAWALGLGDIRLSSALNQPLRAEIELLAATPDELNRLTIQLASQETFRRYDLDRPLFLSSLQFELVKSGRADGNVIRVTSSEPVAEPFITFLVEASWSRGRLLREYTLLLDPPTFAPPPSTQATEAVTAPTRAAPAVSGQIRRPAPQQPPPAPPTRAAVRPPTQTPPPAAEQPAPQPAAPAANTAAVPGQPGFDTAPGGVYPVRRGDTLWGITHLVLPDSRLTINQTMLAIYAANPDAFDGNINRLRAGATLRIPSADDIFRISRGEAFTEVKRQNAEWRGEAAPPPTLAPVVAAAEPQPSLTLVPPDDDEVSLSDSSADTGASEAVDETPGETSVDPVEERIREIEGILQDQDALIEIPDTELAALRQELADLRGEELPPEGAAEDEILADDEAAGADELAADEGEVEEPTVATAPQVVSRPAQQQGIVDKLLGYLNNFWVWIGAALLVTVSILVWFMRRAAKRDDDDVTGVWGVPDTDEQVAGAEASTERLQALTRQHDESIVVVESESPTDSDFIGMSDTLEAPEAPEAAEPEVQDMRETQQLDTPPAMEPPPAAAAESPEASGAGKALEDTFSSETAINLDQSDPVAEADFHMAYGLYDQAADLINGALAAEPTRQDLLAKLCEIYFVWGNRDAFVDAALRLNKQVGGAAKPEWDKIVIMGQQIAPDHEMFSGVSAEGVTRAVDLSLDGDAGGEAGLDIDFASDADAGASDVIDLGRDEEIIDLGMPAGDEVLTDDTGQVSIAPDSGTGIDFSFEEEPDIEVSVTREMPTAETPLDDTDETPPADTTQPAADDSLQAPATKQQFDMESTGELPAMPGADEPQIPATDETAEIDLDDLGLDLDALGESALSQDLAGDGELSDLEDTATSEKLGIDENLAATGRHAELAEDDMLTATGRNETVVAGEDDLEATSTREVIEIEDELGSSGVQDVLDVEEAMAATNEMPAIDDATTGVRKALGDEEATMLASLDDDGEDTDVGIDTSLLDATGQTQILTEDMAVETAADIVSDLDDTDATMLAPGDSEDEASNAIADDAATLLASLDEEEGESDFDFAKTEALPKDVFSPDMSTDDTGRMPGLAGSTDVDLDLDDLTAALKVSEVGDTVNQLRDDATVEQPRMRPGGDDAGATGVTQTLSQDDMTGELHEARTMTEVGTKLDLARAYVDMGDPAGARSILEEVLDEGDAGQKQQARQLIDSLTS